MSESLKKQMKIMNDLAEDLVVKASSFLPIQSLLQNRTVSKAFKYTEIQSLELDFSGICSVIRRHSDVVGVIDNVMNNHIGPEIHHFALLLNHIGVEGNILSWVNICIAKKIQELVLDFSKSNKVLIIPIDFSAIKTLRVLKLRWCSFQFLDDNSSSGLKLLRTLSLMRTTQLTPSMIDAIFINCIHLETLELIECPMLGTLCINAYSHKRFKTLVVSSLLKILRIFVDALTLECFKYKGYVKRIHILRQNGALKEADLHYTRNFHCNDPSDMVVNNIWVYNDVSKLATTTIFLEALKYKYLGGGHMFKSLMGKKFRNLTTFRIDFIAPTPCTLYDIAEFLKMCPNLKQVVIDINNFTFERNMFWEIHYKYEIQSDGYIMQFLEEVKICGYKAYWHEFDMVLFFLEKAPSLKKLVLERPRNQKMNVGELYDAHIDHIKSISPRPDLNIENPSGCV